VWKIQFFNFEKILQTRRDVTRRLTKSRKIMENQTHRSVLMDHKIVIDGVVFREKKEMTTEMTHVVADNFKQCICQFVHSRSIGDRVYVYKFTETATNGVLDGECLKKVKTDVDEDEVQKLGDEWEAKWKPSIGYQPDSGIGALIKKMLNVEN
jgi:hypothetical protein